MKKDAIVTRLNELEASLNIEGVNEVEVEAEITTLKKELKSLEYELEFGL